MAPGPIRGLRYIHEAIRAQAKLVEERCHAARDGNVADLAEAIATLTSAVRGHVEGEDKGYFPALAGRAEHAVASFQFDHDAENERLDELDRFGQSLGDGSDLGALRRASIAFRELIHLHMLKEEELLWPLTEELFSAPEQVELMQAILRGVPPDMFPALVPWIVEMNTVDDAAAYVALLERAQPPELFAKSVEWIRSGVSPARLDALRPRVPALA